jgi:hypothetical protein
MLNKSIDSLDTRFYAIYPDFSYSEFSNLDILFKTQRPLMFAVVKENNGTTKSLFSDRYFAHSRYLFYTNQRESITCTFGDWSLLNVSEPTNRSRLAYFEITDPRKVTKRISNKDLNNVDWSEYFQIQGICKILQLLKDASEHRDWLHFELARKNKELEKRINDLLERIEILENPEK